MKWLISSCLGRSKSTTGGKHSSMQNRYDGLGGNHEALPAYTRSYAGAVAGSEVKPRSVRLSAAEPMCIDGAFRDGADRQFIRPLKQDFDSDHRGHGQRTKSVGHQGKTNAEGTVSLLRRRSRATNRDSDPKYESQSDRIPGFAVPRTLSPLRKTKLEHKRPPARMIVVSHDASGPPQSIMNPIDHEISKPRHEYAGLFRDDPETREGLGETKEQLSRIEQALNDMQRYQVPAMTRLEEKLDESARQTREMNQAFKDLNQELIRMGRSEEARPSTWTWFTSQNQIIQVLTDQREQLLNKNQECKTQCKNSNARLKALEAEIVNLKTENKNLKDKESDVIAKLKQLQVSKTKVEAHLCSLLPNRSTLTSSEAGQGYSDLLGKINGFVEEWTGENMHEPSVLGPAMDESKKQTYVASFQGSLVDRPDILHGCQWPGTETDVIVACVTNFLLKEVFGNQVVGVPLEDQRTIDRVMECMKNDNEVKRTEKTYRFWRAEAYHVIFNNPGRAELRKTAMEALAYRLAYILFGFVANKTFQDFAKSCALDIIEPAILLAEKFHAEANHFFLHVEPVPYFDFAGNYVTEGTAQPHPDPHSMICEDLLHCRKTFARQWNKLPDDEKPTREELDRRLFFIFTTIPALCLQKASCEPGKREEVQTIRKQQVLIGLGDKDERKLFMDMEKENRTPRLVYEMLNPRRGSADSRNGHGRGAWSLNL